MNVPLQDLSDLFLQARAIDGLFCDVILMLLLSLIKERKEAVANLVRTYSMRNDMEKSTSHEPNGSLKLRGVPNGSARPSRLP